MGLGAPTEVAAEIAARTRRWWRNIGMRLNSILGLKRSDRLKYPASVDLNFSNRLVRTACRVV
jgi:hypothetical protein